MISWGDHRTGKFKLELTRSEKFHKCNCYYFQHNCVVPMWCEFAPTAVRLAYPVKTVQFTLNIVRGVVVVVLQLNEKKGKKHRYLSKTILFFSPFYERNAVSFFHCASRNSLKWHRVYSHTSPSNKIFFLWNGNVFHGMAVILQFTLLLCFEVK